MSINSIQFSPDNNYIGVALSNGYAVYSLNPIKKIMHHIFQNQQFGIVSIVPSTKILVCVGVPGQNQFSDHVVCVYDETISHSVFQITDFQDPICNVYVSSTMFAISTKSEVRLYTFDPPVLFCQLRTAINDFGQSAFFCTESNFVLAFTGRTESMLRILSSEESDGQDISFECHQHGISKIVYNQDASLLATAASAGTIIRVWRTPSCEKVAEFRRGSTNAIITSMSFSPSSALLAVCSNRKTVHIFDLQNFSDQRASMTWTIPINSPLTLSFSSDSHLLCAFNSGSVYDLELFPQKKSVNLYSVTPLLDP